MDERKARRSGRKVLFLLLALALAYGAIMTFRVGESPEIEIAPAMPGIGRRTPVTVLFREPSRGLTMQRVELVQGERVDVLAETLHQPREPWRFWGAAVRSEEVLVEVGSETIAGLETGEATIRASAWPAGT